MVYQDYIARKRFIFPFFLLPLNYPLLQGQVVDVEYHGKLNVMER